MQHQRVASLSLLVLLTGVTFGQWGPIVRLSDSDSASRMARIQQNGQCIHVWWSEGNSAVAYSRSTDGGISWSAATTLASGVYSGRSTAIGSGRVVLLCYLEDSNIVLRRSTDNGASWAQGVRIASPGFTAQYGPLDMLTDHRGRVNVFYSNYKIVGVDSVFCTSSTDDGATWSPPTFVCQIAYRTNYDGTFGLVLDSLRNVYSLYLNFNAQDFCCRKSTDNGATWAAPETICAGRCGIFAAAADAHNRLHASWTDDHSGQSEVYYARSTDQGTTWSTTIRLTVGGAGLYWMGLVDSMVYLSYDNWATHKTRRRSFNGGIAWEEESDWLYDAQPGGYAQALLGPSGRIHLVNLYGSPYRIAYWRSINCGTTWTDVAVPISLVDNLDRWLDDIALGADDVHVVWEDYESGNYEIYYRRGVGLGGVEESDPARQREVALQARPSVVSTMTTISYTVPSAEPVAISIYEMNGRLVRKWNYGRTLPGENAVAWACQNSQGSRVEPGVYFCIIQTPTSTTKCRLVVL